MFHLINSLKRHNFNTFLCNILNLTRLLIMELQPIESTIPANTIGRAQFTPKNCERETENFFHLFSALYIVNKL